MCAIVVSTIRIGCYTRGRLQQSIKSIMYSVSNHWMDGCRRASWPAHGVPLGCYSATIYIARITGWAKEICNSFRSRKNKIGELSLLYPSAGYMCTVVAQTRLLLPDYRGVHFCTHTTRESHVFKIPHVHILGLAPSGTARRQHAQCEETEELSDFMCSTTWFRCTHQRQLMRTFC